MTQQTTIFLSAIRAMVICFISFINLAYANTIGLVGHWQLDGVANSITVDSSSTGANAFVLGNTATVAAIFNRGLNLDGETGFAVVTDPGEGWALDVSQSLTLSAWVYLSTTENIHKVIAKDNAFELEIGNGGVGRYSVRLNNGRKGRGNTTLTAGVWHFLTVTWDGSTVHYYLNGQADGMTDYAGTLQENNRHLGIGGRPGNSAIPTQPFAGTLDDVRIYNTVLSAAEVGVLYGAASLPDLPEPTPRVSSDISDVIALWPLDTSSSGTAEDAGPHNISGDILGSASFIEGVQAEALALSTTDDYVRLSDPGRSWPLDLTDALTIALWIKPNHIDGNQKFVAKDNVYEFEMGQAGSGRYSIRLNNRPKGKGDTPLNADQWQHVAVTWDGFTVRYYRNGQPDGSYDYSGQLLSRTSDVGIGARPTRYSPGGVFSGALDDVHIYDTALDDEAIFVLAGSNPPPDPGPHPDHPVKRAEHLAAFDLVDYTEVTDRVVNSGAWSNPATWESGIIPAVGANVLIGEGYTVTLMSEVLPVYRTIRVDGTLNFASDVNTLLKVDTLVVDPSGSFIMGTEAQPIAPDVSARVVIADRGVIDRDWDPQGLSRGLINHGMVSIVGSEMTPFVALAEPPSAGSTQLELASVPTFWSVGDPLVLAGSRLGEHEQLDIVAITDNTLSINSLQFDHAVPRADLRVHR